MSLKSVAAKIFAARIVRKQQKWMRDPIRTQDSVFKDLISKASNTVFGSDHGFAGIQSHSDFAKQVPLRDYEALRAYVERAVGGEKDILWPGKPAYFGKTSGTTSGAKYIPITEESIRCQVRASRDAILNYIFHTGNAAFVNGKMIFLQGSPEMQTVNGIKTGRLSGISAHYVPRYLQRNRLPSWETNCIEDWEEKVEKIIDETIDADMTVIAGIPSWVQMYFERLNDRSQHKIGDLFKNFQLFIYGGVNYEPYRAKFEDMIGRKVDSIELFPASEGFFAFQDRQDTSGMLLLLDSGIFYEFVPAELFFDENPPRLTLDQVELGVNYVMIISTNAGLWAYNVGDTIAFVSLNPFRIIVTGRIKHFISAFGEHVIAKEVEEAMEKAIAGTNARVNEFTVAPNMGAEQEELPYHEWFVEFDTLPEKMDDFVRILDESMQEQNSYYYDLIQGNILQTLKVSSVEQGAFQAYMRSKGRLGGQNKVQRLANDRNMAEALEAYKM